jgi:pyruvate kinase
MVVVWHPNMKQKPEITILRNTKIVCTIGQIPQKKLGKTIKEFIEAGMDVARINMAHFDIKQRKDAEYLKKLIRTIRKKGKKLKKDAAILGDIQGPKVRIKTLFAKRKKLEEVTLKKNEKFVLIDSKKSIPKGKGASVTHEGRFEFFKDIKNKVEKDAKGEPKPIEFWFGDGKVILQTSVENINDYSAFCTVKVAGKLQKGKGVSVKNSKINPGPYRLGRYEKDERDIKFLLAQGVDLLALSFVNSKTDVVNLQNFVRSTIGEDNIKERLFGLDEFPVISKIETWDGYDNLDEIMDASYGILVGRGDLALQTGIEQVGILQKEIIDRCIAEGKPVITATQMLLSMMDFIEPRRSEVADVTNAVNDGSDALMLSEETADKDSKFPRESIEMMKRIIIATEGKRAKNRIDYKYEMDKLHEEAIDNLRKKKAELIKTHRAAGEHHDHNKCEENMRMLRNMQNTEHISYGACKTAFELKCKAIVVSTDTGRTARMISKYGPDMPILAGVTATTKTAQAGIARILRLSYGVEPFVISRKPKDPFSELEQVVKKAKDSERLKIEYQECQKILDPQRKEIEEQLLKSGNRVIFVAGYPPNPGITTFLNIYKI